MTTRSKTKARAAVRQRGSFSARRRAVGVVRPNARTGGFQGIEMKFIDIESVDDAFATTWATMEDGTNDVLSGIVQGNGESQRIGRKVQIHSIHLKCFVATDSVETNGTPAADVIGRYCLVLDKQTNGAQLTATDVMDGGQTKDTLAFRNLQHTRRFQVLWDRKFKLGRSNDTNEANINKYGRGKTSTTIMTYNKRFNPPIPVLFSGNDATVSSITDNSLHMIGVADSTLGKLTYQCRIRYTG